MRKPVYILTLDLFLCALCALGVYRVALKAGLPTHHVRPFVQNDTSVIVTRLFDGDTILAFAGQPVHSNDEVEFICDQYRIGDSVSIRVLRKGIEETKIVVLTKDFSKTKILIESFVGLLFFLIGAIVILLKKNDKSARIFHHLCVSTAILILLTSGRYSISPFGLGYILELFFQASYIFVPVLFFHFTIVFPDEKTQNTRKFLLPLYSIAIVLTVWSGIEFLHAAYPLVNLKYYNSYSSVFNIILIFFSFLFLVGLGNIIHSYHIAKEDFERRKLRWLLFGISFGVCAYIFLFLLPRLFFSFELLNEEWVLALSVVAPVSFAIGIVRFRLFDINVIFRRSTIYAIVIAILLVVYLGIVSVMSFSLHSYGWSSSLADIIGALLIALLFEPLRKQVQKFVDLKFFRISYNVLDAQKVFFEEMRSISSQSKLAEFVTTKVNEIIPVTRIGFFLVEPHSNRIKLVAHRDFDLLKNRGVQLNTAMLKSKLELPVALDEKMEAGIPYESADNEVFKRWGMALVLAFLSADKEIIGFIVLGEKLSQTRFTLEDISLLTSISTQLGLSLERIALERELILEQEESERLSELNQLKSYFVSSVSHDLKTPLTSIRLFAELLKDKEDLPRPKINEYLSIIEGESDRLSRLITNILDFAKIEKGTKEYALKSVDLNDIVKKVLNLLVYQIRSNGFEVLMSLNSDRLVILGDVDAITDAITNLITNAMKYSPSDRKSMTISTGVEDRYAFIKLKDEGYGIDKDEIDKIFDPFYRINNVAMKSAGGAGLGLSLVRHTMDAHGGKVEVISELGKGSIFVLYFPLHLS